MKARNKIIFRVKLLHKKRLQTNFVLSRFIRKIIKLLTTNDRFPFIRIVSYQSSIQKKKLIKISFKFLENQKLSKLLLPIFTEEKLQF